MIAYAIRRLGQAIIVVVIVSIMVFLMVRILPGDPILMFLSTSQVKSMSQEQIEATRREYGLDKPLPVQYINWVNGIFHGDFGKSLNYRVPVTTLLAQRIPVTLYLGVISLILSNILGIAFGLISAVRRGKAMDILVTLAANIGVTIPIFWLGILLIYAFGLKLGWLPVYGYTSPFTDFWQSTRQLVMPVICLACFSMGAVARQTRSSMLEVNRQDYIRTAWAKGLSERMIVMKHVLRNGIIPVVTLSGIEISQILGGAVLVETVFNILGMGRLAVTGLLSLDYAVVQAVVLCMAVLVVFVNFVVDISYGWIDPRIRLT